MRYVIAICVVLIVIAGVVGSVSISLREGEVVTQIKNKDRECRSVSNGNGGSRIDCRYMIYTTNEVFTNEDSTMFWKLCT